MSLKPAMFLTSALVGTGLIAAPLSAQAAGGMTHLGTWGQPVQANPALNGLSCDMPIFAKHPDAVNVGPVNIRGTGNGNFGFNNRSNNFQGNVSAPRANNFGGSQPLNVQNRGNFGGNQPLNVQNRNFGSDRPVAVQAQALAAGLPVDHPGKPDCAHRLVRAAPAGAGHAGDGQRDLRR